MFKNLFIALTVLVCLVTGAAASDATPQITIQSISSPKYSNSGNTTIDVVVVCAPYGTIPMTLTANDPTTYLISSGGQKTNAQLYSQALGGAYGSVGAYVAPAPAPISASIWQLKAVCDAQPALGFTIPTWAQVQAAAASLSNPTLSTFILAFAPQPIPSNSTTIASLNAALPTPMTPTQLATFFQAAASIIIP